MDTTVAVPDGSQFAHHWGLEPETCFLNHGSFGACPRVVLAAQTKLRERLEREPVRFMVRELEPLIDQARNELAAFVGADAADLVFVPNATTAVNAVLRSFDFRSGDELLVTDHGYNACRNVAEFVTARAGARVVVARVPFPLRSADEVVEAIRSAVTPRTRLALIDHVTSPTGLVFPIERLVRELEGRSIPTLVDGAHAPGMVPLNLRELGASYYTGNCHKWICAPKGVGFLVVKRELQAQLRPHVISHGANSPRTDRSRYQIEFDWVGTDDPTAKLCVPEAIRFMGALLPGGWSELMATNRALALEGRSILSAKLGGREPAPPEMIGSLAAVVLPDSPTTEVPKTPLYQDELQDALFQRFHIEVPVVPWPKPPQRLLRISAQVYNAAEQYRYLAEAVAGLLVGRPIS
jgi:isopenicillin-N epimerase